MTSVTAPSLFVICGPPCAGKSTLAAALASALPITVSSMDQWRLRLFPSSQHRLEDVDAAYRASHAEADGLLARRRSVLCDATYGRVGQREALIAMSRRWRVPMHVLQCRVSPQAAVERFLSRGPNHPAVDLDPPRVDLLARCYPYHASGAIVDTERSLAECVAYTLEILRQDAARCEAEWAEAARAPSGWPGPRVTSPSTS